MHDLGTGPRPIARHRLTADALAAAIREAVTDRAMRTSAARLAAAIATEDGAAEAAGIIGSLAGS